MKTTFKFTMLLLSATFLLGSCGNNNGKSSGSKGALNSSNAEKRSILPRVNMTNFTHFCQVVLVVT